MNETRFTTYLQLLHQLTHVLEELTAIEEKKTSAVCQDDLAGLMECMKQEQAQTLALRGLDRKREAALSEMGASDAPLSAIGTWAPAHLRLEAKRAAEDLRRQYELFRGAADVARDTLEINLHQVEKILEKMDAEAVDGFEPELPSNMRTDFKA